MFSLRTALLAATAATATAALGLTTAPVATARPAAPAVASPVSAQDVPCYTSFDPSNPDGASMTQFYRMCETDRSSVTVCAYDIEDNYRHTDGPKWLVYGQVATWYWTRTTPGHHYTTRYC